MLAKDISIRRSCLPVYFLLSFCVVVSALTSLFCVCRKMQRTKKFRLGCLCIGLRLMKQALIAKHRLNQKRKGEQNTEKSKAKAFKSSKQLFITQLVYVFFLKLTHAVSKNCGKIFSIVLNNISVREYRVFHFPWKWITSRNAHIKSPSWQRRTRRRREEEERRRREEERQAADENEKRL